MDARFKNPICQQCVARQLEKYKDFVDENGVVYKDFAVQCNGIPLEYLNKQMKAVLSEQMQKEALCAFDPVEWAKQWVTLPNGKPWEARWYQETMLRCTAKRKVFRCGRRIGKTDTLLVAATHLATTKKNQKILFVAPYKSQINELMGRIRLFASMNSRLGNSIARAVATPFYEIEFYNGSRIRGFTSGTKSGEEGAAIRGQDADLIVIDEADYLGPSDMKAITAILTTNPEVKMIISSTPTGKREHFWKWCTKSPTYKEFHFETSVLPFWDEIKEQIKADYSGDEDGWTHEILAEFGEQAVSLFQKKFIDSACKDYEYGNITYIPTWIYTMGVDWNSEHGTEIVVVGFDGVSHWMVVDAQNVPKQEWTQLAACEKVVEIFKKWQPAYLIPDEGAGMTAIEILKKMSADIAFRNPRDPLARLKDVIEPYNFSSKIEIRDPLTKQKIKKHAKPFLVENAVRFFEEGKISISAHDTVLKKQLESYIIKHRTPAGVPVYGLNEPKVGDHRLDAFMLALIAFRLKMSDFSLPSGVSKVVVQSTGAIDPEKLINAKLSKPGERFNVENNSVVGSAIPGNTRHSVVEDYRYGFNTDEEAKYKRRFARKRLLKQRRSKMGMPSRTNI